jgi:hypothetical protein
MTVDHPVSAVPSRELLEYLKAPFTWIFSVVPIGLLGVMVVRTFTGNYDIVISLSFTFLGTLLSLVLVRKGKVLWSVRVFTLVLLATLTYVCTDNNGIHDIGIFAYPIILVLVGMVLGRTDQWVFQFLLMLSIAWLALGEQFGYYTPSKVPSGSIAELLVLLVILGTSTLICYQIAQVWHRALYKASDEAARRKAKSNDLAVMLQARANLTNAMHGQVAESMSIIREIVRREAPSPFIYSLNNHLITLEIIHNQLHYAAREREVKVRDFLSELATRLPDRWQGVSLQVDETVSVTIDQAVALGLIVDECVAMEHGGALLAVDNSDKGIVMSFKTQSGAPPQMSDLCQAMIRQMQGQWHQGPPPGECQIVFTNHFAEP